jgi:heme oxygenase (biliverdin-IX-beta and delta-forming)
MDDILRKTLAHLIRTQRIAALGTLHDGAPFISMILYAVSPDFQSFYTLISRLAQHTRDILKDPRVGLMIVETDDDSQDPQQLARISITGQAVTVAPDSAEYESAKTLYFEKFPQAAFNLTLKDFSFYRITPQSVRYVAGFAQAYDLSTEDLKSFSGIG